MKLKPWTSFEPLQMACAMKRRGPLLCIATALDLAATRLAGALLGELATWLKSTPRYTDTDWGDFIRSGQSRHRRVYLLLVTMYTNPRSTVPNTQKKSRQQQHYIYFLPRMIGLNQPFIWRVESPGLPPIASSRILSCGAPGISSSRTLTSGACCLMI